MGIVKIYFSLHEFYLVIILFYIFLINYITALNICAYPNRRFKSLTNHVFYSLYFNSAYNVTISDRRYWGKGNIQSFNF